MPKFKHYENRWNITEWQNYCPSMEYRVKQQSELPNWFPQTLISKINSAVVACSACENSIVFVINNFRIHKNEIDEHPFVVAFDNETGNSYSGFIEHSDFNKRTTQIPTEMLRLLSISGIDVNFKFERKPDNNKGTLIELQKEGKLIGFDKAVKRILNETTIIKK